LYDSIPVLHVRNAASWARYTQADGKKVFIIENAERMIEGARNALLKILEEPPDDTVFVLTTSKRSAMMPTILSRMRSYHFYERDPAQSAEIISRIFHADSVSSIDIYLNSFLPVDPVEVGRLGGQFFIDALSGKIPDIKKTETAAGKFEPRILLAAFFNGMFARAKSMRDAQNPLRDAPAFAKVTELEFECLGKIRECYGRITTYNQSTAAALEILVSELASIGSAMSFKDLA
jgi:DNA polymerase-3 subunit gamma/tau